MMYKERKQSNGHKYLCNNESNNSNTATRMASIIRGDGESGSAPHKAPNVCDRAPSFEWIDWDGSLRMERHQRPENAPVSQNGSQRGEQQSWPLRIHNSIYKRSRSLLSSFMSDPYSSSCFCKSFAAAIENTRHQWINLHNYWFIDRAAVKHIVIVVSRPMQNLLHQFITPLTAFIC